jgi:hypothetical protein
MVRPGEHRNLQIAASSPGNAVNFSSARTTNRFPSSRWASTIQIIRLLRRSIPQAKAVPTFKPRSISGSFSSQRRKIIQKLRGSKFDSPETLPRTGLGKQQKLNRCSLLSRSASANRHERCAGRLGGLSGRQDKIGRASLRATPSSAPFPCAARCRRNRRSPMSQN